METTFRLGWMHNKMQVIIEDYIDLARNINKWNFRSYSELAYDGKNRLAPREHRWHPVYGGERVRNIP